jgi:hypothetical protein
LRAFSTFAELQQYLREAEIEHFVLKPVNGTRGQAVFVLRYDAKKGFFDGQDKYIDPNNLEKSLSYSYRGKTEVGFLLQNRIFAHPLTRDMSPNCPLSYRAITLVDRRSRPHLITIFGKMATGGNCLDNTAQGGLILVGDEKGRVIDVKQKNNEGCVVTRNDMLSQLRGWELPMYREVCELALNAALRFANVRCVGWDIAVGSEGLVIFEGNNPWSELAQVSCGRGLWTGVFRDEAAEAIAAGPQLPPWW